jgi:hypothetical protein
MSGVDPASEVQECVLCGYEFVGWGNNPEPLAAYEDGRACDLCNGSKVIPARLRAITGDKDGGVE